MPLLRKPSASFHPRHGTEGPLELLGSGPRDKVHQSNLSANAPAIPRQNGSVARSRIGTMHSESTVNLVWHVADSVKPYAEPS